MYKQLIIARKDLKMTSGKLAAQVSHASMAFLTNAIKQNSYKAGGLICGKGLYLPEGYCANLIFDIDIYEQWIEGSFTKIICEARNKNHIMRAVGLANELGLEEGKDYFLIRDNCLTELTPEDEDGRTLTCIGFRPMESEIVEKISKKYQLYR